MEKKYLSVAEQKELKMILGVKYDIGYGEDGIAKGIVKRKYSLLEVLDVAKALKAQISKDGDTWDKGIIVSRVFGNDKLVLSFDKSYIAIYMVGENEKDLNDTKSNFYFSMRKYLHAIYYTPKYWVAIVSYPFIVCIHRERLDIQILWPFSR